MHGLDILRRSLSEPTMADRSGRPWQYHSRSDTHSKIACWAILFDLLLESAVLREQALTGQIGFGINHDISDFKQDRKKNLDLVICKPGKGKSRAPQRSMSDLAEDKNILLSEVEAAKLANLPDLMEAPVGSVLVALEAKACMTAHQKALPRLYDELNSSHSTVHGAFDQAIAVGFAMVNAADRFVSPDRNKGVPLTQPIWSLHNQPKAAELTVKKLRQLPRRSRPGESGYDASLSPWSACTTMEARWI